MCIRDSNIGISLGDSNDTTFTHTPTSGTQIDHTGTDDLRFRLGQNQIIFEKTSGENFIVLDHSDGEVNLCHAATGDVKLETKSDGVDITGVLDVSESANIGDIQIDFTSRTVTTTSGNLILTAATDDVDVTGELFVSDKLHIASALQASSTDGSIHTQGGISVSYTHLRAHETLR